MARLSRAKIDRMILEWRDRIEPEHAVIRRAQDELLIKAGPENADYVLTIMAGILGKGVVTVANTTNIGNAGVAITGGDIGGSVTGTAQGNISTISGPAFDGLNQLRNAIESAHELTSEQKEDAKTAVEDLEEEGKKPKEQRRMGRVRNALSTLASIASFAASVQQVYEWAAPHVQSLFH